MSIQRVSAGVPTGGQFSVGTHEEADLSLDGEDLTPADQDDDRCAECGQWTSSNREHICYSHAALASRMDEVHHKVDVANRRLARLGLEERFEVEILGERSESRTNDAGERETREMVDYKLNRPAIKLGDWQFAGRLDFLDDGTPVAMTAPDVELHGFRPETQMCDHCGTNRNRTSTYLLQSGDGEVKQVGSNCLEAFTGIAPKGLWSMEWEPDDASSDDEGGFGSGGWERAAAPGDVLRMALAVTDNGRSYMSVARAEYSGQNATSGTVRLYLFPSPRERDTPEYQAAAALAQAPETAELAKQVLEYARTIEGDDDYPSNLRSMAAQEHLSSKHIGLMASAVSGWRRKQEQEAKAEADRATPALNEWAGTAGEKLTAISATVVGTQYIPGDRYGGQTLITIRDDKGRTLKWFASNPPDVEEGGRVTIDKATIKGLDEYQGAKQTMLTRAKLTLVE